MAKQDNSGSPKRHRRASSRSPSHGDDGRGRSSNQAVRRGSKRRTMVQHRKDHSSETTMLGGRMATAGAKVVGAVRENPIPAALLAAGVTWLLIRNRQRLPVLHMPALGGLSENMRESFNASAQATRRAIRGGFGSAAEAVKDGAASVAGLAQGGAAKVGQAAKKGLARSRNAVAETWDAHPLAVGLGLLAAGLAAGIMLPTPRSASVKRAARGLSDRVTTTGEELLDTARDVVASSARAVSREARRQGLTPAAISRKVKRVASAVTA